MKQVLVVIDDAGNLAVNAKGVTDPFEIIEVLLKGQKGVLDDIRSKMAPQSSVVVAPAAALLSMPNGRKPG
jgi:hypothetical protein